MTIKWTEELVTDICDHLSTGKSVLEIGEMKGYPSSDSIYRQMYRDPEFAAAIARAREAGQDHEADACIQMADLATPEDHQVVKLRIWARQWRAAKIAPKRYGDKQTVEHTGDAFASTETKELKEQLAKLAADPALRALLDGGGA